MRTNLVTNKMTPVKERTKKTPSSSKLDMVIAFDTTGSMSSYIDNVKEHCTQLVPELLAANPDMKISVVAFGDYCDMKSKDEFGDAYQVLPLTDNKDEILDFIMNAKNTCGGDGDEFYELVIKKITEETNWREDSTKAVLLIADARPHGVGYSYGDIVKNAQIDWKEEAEKAAKQGIKFDTLGISWSLDWYKELSSITNGTYAPFSSSSKTQHAVKAAVYSKVAATMDLFNAEKEIVTTSGDRELTALYNAYSKEIL